jgi:hypothetical protein
VAVHDPQGTLWTLAVGGALATAFMLYRFFAYVKRDRFVQDTPLMRIRSAAQGYVHFEGQASPTPGESMSSPLSARSCVWWDYRVAKRYRNAKGQTEWEVIDQASSVAPFLLSDGDGHCQVGPVGADITPTSQATWFGDAPRPTSGPLDSHPRLLVERDYRYTERIIAPGTHLSVLGELRSQSSAIETDQQVHDLLAKWKEDQGELLAKFDRNHDGHIDAEEWEAVRAAARAQVEATLLQTPVERVSVVAQTRHGEPFLIAPLNEQQLVRREQRYAAISLLMSVLFVILTAWAIHRALSIHAV